MLPDEAGPLDLWQNAAPLQRFHAAGQQRLPNVKTREPLPLEYHHPPPGLGEQRSRRAPRRPTAQHRYVKIGHLVARIHRLPAFIRQGSPSVNK
jgi:hypothetical protein